MVAPIHKDNLTAHQLQLTAYMRVFSPISGIFSATDINTADIVKNRSVLIPDIRVDDYIVDPDISRIGADHYSGSEFTSEWKNGIPPTEWRRYSMSRRRAYGYTIFDDQVRYLAIPNLQQEYERRKLDYTVLRDHDKYLISAILQGHMTGKQVARTSADAVGPVTPNVHLISHTGNAGDYKWISEPGETYDNEIPPSFASIKGRELNAANPLSTVDSLTLDFADNWFDSNTSIHGERFLIIPPALELGLINYLIDQGNGTETAFDMLRNGNTSGAFDKGQAAGYLGTIKGSWKLIKMHPEFFPKLFFDANLVVDPLGYTGKPGVTLKQVVAIAAYSKAAQTFDYFSERRQQDGGTRFKGTEYVQEMSYDAWVIEQRSEAIVPLVLPNTLGDYLGLTNTSFTNVANQVAAARAQLSVAPNTYPITGYETLTSRPEWFHGDYTQTSNLDSNLPAETGDMSHVHPTAPGNNPFDAAEVAELQETVADLSAVTLSETNVRAVSTAYPLNDHVTIQGKLFKATTAGTSSATATASLDLTGIDVGDTITDGTAVWTRVL